MKSLRLNLMGVALLLLCFHGAVQGGQLQPVSRSTGMSAFSGGDSVIPVLSSDGRYILFASTANDLALTTNNTRFTRNFPARFNVFLRDQTNAVTSLVSVNLKGEG